VGDSHGRERSPIFLSPVGAFADLVPMGWNLDRGFEGPWMEETGCSVRARGDGVSRTRTLRYPGRFFLDADSNERIPTGGSCWASCSNQWETRGEKLSLVGIGRYCHSSRQRIDAHAVVVDGFQMVNRAWLTRRRGIDYTCAKRTGHPLNRSREAGKEPPQLHRPWGARGAPYAQRGWTTSYRDR